METKKSNAIPIQKKIAQLTLEEQWYLSGYLDRALGYYLECSEAQSLSYFSLDPAEAANMNMKKL